MRQLFETNDMMRDWIALSVVSLASLLVAEAKSAGKPLPKSDTVIWAGLDYSMVRLVGPGDFHNPEAIFPEMLDKWNELFLRERVRRIGQILHKEVIPDAGGMTERNRLATSKQIIPSGGPADTVEQSHITDKDIATAVRSYKLEAKEGLALAFIVDRLVKPSQKGAVYVVFFDAKTRDVIASSRHVGRASGAGFRNYWFRVIKETEAELSKHR
jgi:hypothetical protein